MDNLIVLAPWVLGLTLFFALWAVEWLSARRQQKRMEKRLTQLTSSSTWEANEAGPIHYGLTYPKLMSSAPTLGRAVRRWPSLSARAHYGQMPSRGLESPSACSRFTAYTPTVGLASGNLGATRK